MTVSKSLMNNPVPGYRETTQSEMKNIVSTAPMWGPLPSSDTSIHWNAQKSAVAPRDKEVQFHLQVHTLRGHFYIMTILSFVLVKILLL
jgi:hypothetical protein